METADLIKLLIPVILLQFGLIGYAIFDLSRQGVRNLNKALWILIILFVNMVGPILYLIFGRGDGNDAESE